MDSRRRRMPLARAKDLVVEELQDETLVYDLQRNKAHCLSPTAAFVWKHCDGRTGVLQVAKLLEQRLGLPADEAIVWMALDRVERAHLLDQPLAQPGDGTRYSRRAMMRRLGAVGGISLLLPVVSSVVAPAAAQGGSCITRGECRALVPPACTGQPVCAPPAGKCCLPKSSVECKEENCP